MTYTDNNNLLNPRILEIYYENFKINLNPLGIYKNTYWKFQNEWRYILRILPITPFDTVYKTSRLAELQYEIITGRANLPFSYFDLSIKPEYYSEMEITLAPDISESAKLFVELAVNKFNPTATIKESALARLLK